PAGAGRPGMKRWSWSWLALLPLSCGSPSRPPPAQVAWTPSAQPGDLVVARVGGEPVYASMLAEHARSIHSDRRRALEDLVAQELLAQEARRRGLGQAPEVLLARKQALVRRFIRLEFEKRAAAPESVPEHDAQKRYQQMHEYFH